MEQITVDELLAELAALGLTVHVELAKARIVNRRLQTRLDKLLEPTT